MWSRGKQLLKASLKAQQYKRQSNEKKSPMDDAKWWCEVGLDKDCFQLHVACDKGYDVVTTQPFESGDFLLECVGARSSTQYAPRKGNLLHYKFNGSEFTADVSNTFGRLGHVVRGADGQGANAVIRIVDVRGSPRLCLFATRELHAGAIVFVDLNHPRSQCWPPQSSAEPDCSETSGSEWDLSHCMDPYDGCSNGDSIDAQIPPKTSNQHEFVECSAMSDDETPGAIAVPDLGRFLTAPDSAPTSPSSMVLHPMEAVACTAEPETASTPQLVVHPMEAVASTSQAKPKLTQPSPTSDHPMDVVTSAAEPETASTPQLVVHPMEAVASTSQAKPKPTQPSPTSDHPMDVVTSGFFLCADCGKVFRKKSGLATHIKVHRAPHDKYVRPKRGCPFCGNHYEKLARHISSVHADNLNVKQAAGMDKEDRYEQFKRFKNMGIEVDNKVECTKQDPKFVTQKRCDGDILRCGKCATFYSKKTFYRHRAKCQGEDTYMPKPTPASLLNASDNDPLFAAQVLSGILDDNVGQLCRSDETILLIGARLWQKDKAKLDKTMEVRKSVRSSMRTLARLHIEFQLHVQKCTEVKDMFDRSNFSSLRDAINAMTERTVDSSSSDSTVKYGMKTNLYYLLLNSAEIMKGSNLEKKGSEEMAVELDRFVSVLKLNQNYIFGDAKYHLSKARQERLRLPSRLPEEEDMEKLRTTTLETIKKLSDTFQHVSKHEFVALRNAVCSRLTLFNARRGGEPSRLKLCQWQDRDKWLDPTACSDLSPLEKECMSKLKVTYQTGKGNKLVSVIVPLDCVKGLDILCNDEVRQMAGVSLDNPHIFANTEGSSHHVIGWDTVHFMTTQAKIEGGKINATTNRCRISTIYAGLEVSPEDRHHFYRHMGHTEEVNANRYQRPLPVQDILKAGQPLTSIDQRTITRVGVDELTTVAEAAVSLDTTPANDTLETNYYKWTPTLSRSLYSNFGGWIDLPSGSKLPAKKIVLEWMAKMQVKIEYTKVRTKIMNEQRLAQRRASLRLKNVTV